MSSATAPGTQGVAPLRFEPIDIGATQSQALATDIKGYDLADKDLAARLPGLVAGNKDSVASAYKELTGPLDPTVQNAFTTQGIESSLASTGGGNALAGVGPVGSASGNAAAVSIGNQVEQKQDYDRSYLDQVLAANPERSFGLSGGDAANLSISNVQNQNANNQAKYALKVQQENAGGGF